MMKMSEITYPSACRYCGTPEREHMSRWDEIAGWHTWKMPYQWQIKDRMQARRNSPEGRSLRWQG